jgi:hypothetical protein
MYTIKDFTYAEAGKYLQGKKAKGFGAPTSLGPYTERDVIINDLEVTEQYITFDCFKWINPNINSYADAKKFIIGKRYSNDDQIAIMLNKDNSEEDELAYQKMQD